MPDELGQIKPGFYADLILVDGDPLQDITVLQNRDRIVGIMKGGAFHKDPGHGAPADAAAPADQPVVVTA
ncbi:amidohydrolase family protein [Streptomyces sp. NPDC005820]|uniref:amidohydrolase family protein n=1 Tax=Streptomyces sp. NPDC005820 TaxID=3157069 RepID=UPI0033EC4F65